MTTLPSGFSRPGCLPIVILALLIGIVGLVIIMNRGDGGSGVVASPTTVATTLTTMPVTPTTVATVSTTTTTRAAPSTTTTATSVPEPVITYPAEFARILGYLGVPDDQVPGSYGLMMDLDPTLHQSGPRLIDPDDHLMLQRYTHIDVSLDADRASELGSMVIGDPTTGDYLVFIGETGSADLTPGTLYQYGLLVSSTPGLLAPSPGEIGPLGRITGALLAWYLDMNGDGWTLSGYGLPGFVPLVSNAFGYVDGTIFVFGIPVGELPDEYVVFIETFGRNSAGTPAADDPAGYTVTGGYQHG